MEQRRSEKARLEEESRTQRNDSGTRVSWFKMWSAGSCSGWGCSVILARPPLWSLFLAWGAGKSATRSSREVVRTPCDIAALVLTLMTALPVGSRVDQAFILIYLICR